MGLVLPEINAMMMMMIWNEVLSLTTQKSNLFVIGHVGDKINIYFNK